MIRDLIHTDVIRTDVIRTDVIRTHSNGRLDQVSSIPYPGSGLAATVLESYVPSPVDRARDRFADENPALALHPLAVVIAAYNEQDGIGDVLAKVPDMVGGLRVSTLVVSDGRADNTADVARGSGALVCELPENCGQGTALRLGYELAEAYGARIVATLDADGQYDPAQLISVVEPIASGRADFVSGSRRLGQAHTSDRTRSAGVVVFGTLITALTRHRVTDPANGLRAMRVEVPASIPLEQPQYQAAELLVGAICRGWKVAEVPTSMFERSAGHTKKGRNLAYGWRFAKVIGRTWWRDRTAPHAARSHREPIVLRSRSMNTTRS